MNFEYPAFSANRRLTKDQVARELAKERQKAKIEHEKTLKQEHYCDGCGQECGGVYYLCEHGKHCYNCVVGTYKVGEHGQKFLQRCEDKIGQPVDCTKQKMEYH